MFFLPSCWKLQFWCFLWIIQDKNWKFRISHPNHFFFKNLTLWNRDVFQTLQERAKSIMAPKLNWEGQKLEETTLGWSYCMDFKKIEGSENWARFFGIILAFPFKYWPHSFPFPWFSKQIAKETADKFAKCSPEEHIPLEKSMLAMAVKAICVAGMGRMFMDEKEIDKLTTMYDVVRYL